MADAEVVITPEVSRTALKKSMNEIEKGMKKTAKDSGEYFEEALGDAGKKGGASMSSGLKNGLKFGLAGAATAVAGALVAGFQVAQQQVESAEGTLEGLLGERDATDLVNFARGQGMTTAELGAMQTRVLQAGGDEQMSRDFVVDTSEYIAQARKGENDLLANFTQYKGADQFNAILATLSGLDADARNKFLADIGWAGDAGVINNMLAGLKGSEAEVYKQLQTRTKADEKRAEMIEKEAALEKQFADVVREANVNAKTGLLENLDGGDIQAYGRGLEARQKAELDAVINYEKNAQIAADAAAAKKKLDKVMLDFFTWAYDVFRPAIMKFIKVFTPMTKKEKAEKQAKAQADYLAADTSNDTDTGGAFIDDGTN